MLVLTRDRDESIDIGPDIRITLVRTQGRRARIAIEAPQHVRIMRSELNEADVDSRSTTDSESAS